VIHALILCLSFSLSFSSLAQELSAEQVAASIVKHFPLIEEQEMKLEATKAEVTASEGAFDTNFKVMHRNHFEERYDNDYTELALEKLTPYSGISLLAGHRRGLGLFAPYEGKFDTSRAGELFAGISFPLLRGRAIDEFRLGLRVSKVNELLAMNELRIKKNLYVFKGLSAFQKWKFAFRRIQTQQGLLKLAEERQEMLARRFKAGDVEEIKIKDNLRSVNKRQEELLKAEMDFEKFSAELSLYYRDDEGKAQNVSSKKPYLKGSTYHPPQFKSASLPQMQIIDFEIEKNQLEKKFNENLKLPSLNIGALAGRELAPDYPYDPQKIYLSVNFQYPLENRRAEGKTVSSVYKGLALEKRKQWIENELRTLYDQGQSLSTLALKRTNVIDKELGNAKDVAAAERKRWASGVSDLFVVALREQEAADVEVKLWAAHYEYEQLQLDVRLYTASLIE
jgi:outer membrane protein, heavy metal efflux system